jgi:streptogrisin C
MVGKLFRFAALLSSVVIWPSLAVAQGSSDPARRDAEEVARLQGVSVDEAIRRIALQDKLAAIQSQLEADPAFGGVEIVSSPTAFEIRVKFTSAPDTKIAQYFLDPALRNAVLGSSTPISLSALQGLQDKLLTLFATLRQPTGITIDISKGQIVGLVRDPAVIKSLVDKLNLGAFVRLEQRTQFPQPVIALEGGNVSNNVRGDGSLGDCTTAFGVKATDGSTGILQAGHCVQAAPGASWTGTKVTVQGVQLTTRNSIWDATRDFSWAANGTDVGTNRISDGNAGRAITSVATSLPAKGATVCKFGRKSGYACALVENNSYKGTDGFGGTLGPIVQVLGGAATNIAQCGDSGGPVFYASQAYGVISRGDKIGKCQGGNELLYIPISRVSGMSVTVITQ